VASLENYKAYKRVCNTVHRLPLQNTLYYTLLHIPRIIKIIIIIIIICFTCTYFHETWRTLHTRYTQHMKLHCAAAFRWRNVTVRVTITLSGVGHTQHHKTALCGGSFFKQSLPQSLLPLRQMKWDSSEMLVLIRLPDITSQQTVVLIFTA